MTPGIITKTVVSLRQRNISEKTSPVIAIAMAYAAYIPRDKDIPVKQFFKDNILPTVKKIINELNERQVVDVAFVLDATEDTWARRYSAQHEPYYDPLPVTEGLELNERQAAMEICSILSVEFPTL